MIYFKLNGYQVVQCHWFIENTPLNYLSTLIENQHPHIYTQKDPFLYYLSGSQISILPSSTVFLSFPSFSAIPCIEPRALSMLHKCPATEPLPQFPVLLNTHVFPPLFPTPRKVFNKLLRMAFYNPPVPVSIGR